MIGVILAVWVSYMGFRCVWALMVCADSDQHIQAFVEWLHAGHPDEGLHTDHHLR